MHARSGAWRILTLTTPTETYPHSDDTQRKAQTQVFFSTNYKTSCVIRGFEYLSIMLLRRVIANRTCRQWETHAFSAIFWFWGKLGFFGHNFGSRHARRSIKGSIDADDHLVSKKILSHEMAHWIAPRASQNWWKIKKHPHFVRSSQENSKSKSKKYFLIETRQLAASVEGLNTSLATAAGELWPKSAGHCSALKGSQNHLGPHYSC